MCRMCVSVLGQVEVSGTFVTFKVPITTATFDNRAAMFYHVKVYLFRTNKTRNAKTKPEEHVPTVKPTSINCMHVTLYYP